MISKGTMDLSLDDVVSSSLANVLVKLVLVKTGLWTTMWQSDHIFPLWILGSVVVSMVEVLMR